jgi:hypothetical protein
VGFQGVTRAPNQKCPLPNFLPFAPPTELRPTGGRYVSCDCHLDHHDSKRSTGFGFRKENIREIDGRGKCAPRYGRPKRKRSRRSRGGRPFPCTRSCGFEASETIPFPGADSIFSSPCGTISGRLRLPSAPLAPRSRRPKGFSPKDRRSALRSPPETRPRNKYTRRQRGASPDRPGGAFRAIAIWTIMIQSVAWVLDFGKRISVKSTDEGIAPRVMAVPAKTITADHVDSHPLILLDK